MHLDTDLGFTSKSVKLKAGDSVYYYNCDKLSADIDTLQDELTLIDKKRLMREQRKAGKMKLSNQIMQGVIDNLRELRIDDKQRDIEELMEEEQKGNSKNTQSIASIVLKSYCNRKTIGNRLEKQKARRYRKSKARILGDLCELREENLQTKERVAEQIEDELQLGKRKRPSKQLGFDSLVNQSTDYSKKSWEADRNSSSNGDRSHLLSNVPNKQILQESLFTNPFLSQPGSENHRFQNLFSSPPANHK